MGVMEVTNGLISESNFGKKVILLYCIYNLYSTSHSYHALPNLISEFKLDKHEPVGTPKDLMI